jgi:hypothetical protein
MSEVFNDDRNSRILEYFRRSLAVIKQQITWSIISYSVKEQTLSINNIK